MTAPRTETRVDLRTLVAGLGAVLLLVSLFLDWYGDPQDNGAITAWRSFELLDVVLAALALVVLYDLATTFVGDWPRPTVSLFRFAGPVALVLVVVSMIDEPPVPFFFAPELELGIWLAFAGALLMTLGSLLGRVRVTFVTSRDEPRPPPARPYDPDTETRPVP